MIGSEDNEEFEVDKIVAQRKNDEGVIEYKIRWKGFDPDYDTWEPEINLIGCEEVLKEFKINNGIIKQDFEDGEVSETDSSHYDGDDNSYDNRKLKKISKGKKRKSKKRNNSKSDSTKPKVELQPPDVQIFNNDMGIKVEIAIDSSNQEKQIPKSTPNYNMGASELLLNYYSNISMPPLEAAPEFKQEIVDLTDDNVVLIKEEKGYYEPQEKAEHCEELDDSDSDLEGQLKVVINEEQETAKEKSAEESESALQSEKARSWRDQLDTVNFKIRKSQRKDLCQLDNGESIPVLAKDKWSVKLKDSQTEAFYHLPVVQSLSEVRLRVEKEIIAIKNTKSVSSKEDLIRAIEEGNSEIVWNTLLCKGGNVDCSLYDGELLILASKLGYSDIIGMIIRTGLDVNYQNEEGITPLMTACENGHEIVCQLLIMNGAHINFINKKSESAILKAVTRGQKECLAVLLQYGCDVFSLDNDKSPLQISRQRNLHEIEALITDYHKKLSDKLTNRFINLIGSLVTVSYVLFPLRILSLYEEKDFVLEFETKFPPVKEDECNILTIFTGFVQDKQIQCCFEQVSNVKSVFLNDISQQSLVPENKNYLMSMAPILDGKNVLKIEFESTIDCRWIRSLAIGFRVKINPNKTI